jgi:hypothetical protein
MNTTICRTILALGSIALLSSGCAMMFEEEEQAAQKMPVNCATAQGDIRLLQSEKAHVVQQIAMGATAIYPAGLVMGIVTGTETTKLQVATGEYNGMIDRKIAEIKGACGV